MDRMREGCLFKVEGYGRFERTLLPLKGMSTCNLSIAIQKSKTVNRQRWHANWTVQVWSMTLIHMHNCNEPDSNQVYYTF